MTLLRLISWPYMRKHALRTALMTAGIVLGVAVLVGMNSANQGVLQAFSRTVDRIAGKTELQVTAGETGFPEETLERVQAAPAVRIAVPVIEAVVRTTIRGEGSLLLVAVDLTGDRSLREYDLERGDDAIIDDPLVFLAQPDSIILARTFAERNGVTVGSELPLGTAQGVRRFVVRGIMKPAGLATAFGGNVAVMDVYAAQKMLGRGRTFDRIDIALRPGRSLADGTQELRTLLGAGFQVDPPAQRAQYFGAMIASFALMMRASSLFALLVGMFIIYNSFATAVAERRAEIGILRALGASRGQIGRLFLAESFLTGLVGSALGVVAGVALARGFAVTVGAIVSDAFGLPQEAGSEPVSPILLVTAMAIGVVTSMAAALVPALAAARVDPVEALQKGTFQRLSPVEHRARIVAGLFCGVTAAVCLIPDASRPVFYVSYLTVTLGMLLLAAPLAALLARLLRPLLTWLMPVEGALAADRLILASRRVSATVAALMLSVGLLVAFAGMGRASHASILDWVQTTLNPDLFVTPSQDIVIRTIRFPAAMTDELQTLSGVRRVQAVRNARVVFRGTPVMLLALDLLSIEELTPVRVTAGGRDMFRVAAAGAGVLVSDSLAQLHRLKQGDILDVPVPGEVVRLPIVGILVDYSDQQGVIFIDRSLFQRYWQDDSVNFYRVYLADGADVGDVKRRILERFAGERQLFVLNNDELKTYILRLADQWFALTYVQVAIAAVVAVLGIVNTLTVSIVVRRRELAVLQAVGALKGQIRRTIWTEALATAFVGVILGGLLGAVNLYYVLEIVRADLAGMRLQYQFPLVALLGAGALILSAAFLAALWPAEAATRGSLVEALEYE
jgi:putative ABC transport system permease protein